MKQITLKECYTNQAKIRPEKIFITHSLHRKIKPINYFENSKISNAQFYDILQNFADKFGHDDLFDLIPSIDIFASDNNRQTICKKWITKEQNFFDLKYDDINWKHDLVWGFPPSCRSIFVKHTIQKYKDRQIKGFLCLPYLPDSYEWYGRIQSFTACKKFITMKGRKRENDIYIADKSIIDRCAFDIIVYYLNYQK